MARDNLREIRKNAYREVILASAERVFAEYGFEAARMQTVADQAEVSVGTIYSVFGSKPELFSAVLTHRLPELLQVAKTAAIEAQSAADRLFLGMDAYIAYLLAHPDWLKIHIREHAWGLGPTRAAPEQLAAWREGLALEAEVIGDAMAEGHLIPGDPTLVARSLAAVQQVYLHRWLELDMASPPEAVRAELRELLVSLFCTGPQSAEGIS